MFQTFLCETIMTPEALELLMRLSSLPRQARTADDLAAALGMSLHDARAALSRLAEGGLVTETRGRGGPAYLYAPANFERESLVGTLQEAYLDNAPALLKRLNERAFERVRQSARQVFGSVISQRAKPRLP